MLPCLGCSLLVKGVQTYQLPWPVTNPFISHKHFFVCTSWAGMHFGLLCSQPLIDNVQEIFPRCQVITSSRNFAVVPRGSYPCPRFTYLLFKLTLCLIYMFPSRRWTLVLKEFSNELAEFSLHKRSYSIYWTADGLGTWAGLLRLRALNMRSAVDHPDVVDAYLTTELIRCRRLDS